MARERGKPLANGRPPTSLASRRKPAAWRRLSYAQERLWFLEQLEPENPAYQRPWALRLRGGLQPEALQWCLNEIVRRHEILRTNYTAVDGLPVQMVRPAGEVELPVLDLQGLPAEAREAEARRRIVEVGRRPLDLAHDAIVRPELIRLAADDHVLFLRTHHIAFDGWSEGVLLRELSELYPARLAGRPSPLPEPELQYADFAAWQHSPEAEAEIRPHLSYWKELFTALPARVVLPVTPPPSQLEHWEAGREAIELEPGLPDSIRALAREENATAFMVFFAAFLVLLHRLTGQTDLVVGYPSAGRSRRELEACIGTFVEALPLRADLCGEPSFRELLRRVRRQVLEGLAHQDLPFERLVAEVHPERSTAHAPLFDILFNSHVLPGSVRSIGDLSLEPFQAPDAAARYLMTLYIETAKDPAAIEMVFKRTFIPADDVRSWLREYRHLLRQVVQDADRALGAYTLVTPEDARRLPDPREPIPFPVQPSLIDQVRAWSERTPSSPALEQEATTWSYQEVMRATDAIAAALASAGIRQGDVVGVTGARTFGLVAAMLGSLQAGAVLLPLDPHLPSLRLQRMQTLARPRLILAAGDPRSPSPAGWAEAPWWPIDPDEAHPIGQVDPAESAPHPGDGRRTPATIFFTSGSTGDPKGILGSREGLAHFIGWQRDTFEVGPGDRVALLTGLSFDVVLRDLLLPLTSGATLCLPPEEIARGARAVLSWLESARITLLHAVPSLARTWLMDRKEGVSLSRLRWTFFAGEALTGDFVGRWREAFPDAGGCANLYGPTETTLAKCHYVVPAEPPEGILPIGRPLPQAQALILSPDGEARGIGEAGEIVLRTPFRSLGYLSPEGPEPRFRPLPLSDDPQDQLYWTGDVGRRLPNGELQFLGRLDDQLKIHGVRVEPGEVAATLNTHPNVSASAVVPVEGNRMTAYVVPQGRAPAPTDLRAYLAARLPTAMIPAAFVTLASLPLLPNGKLDRRALPPVPDRPAEPAGRSFAPPRDRLEHQLAAIWEDVLGSRPIGLQDNFFDLGGHSLLAVRLFARIERSMGRKLPVRALFEAPTLGGLAGIVRAQDWAPASRSALVALQTEGSLDPIFWVHAAGGYVITFRKLAAHIGLDRPAFALEGIEFPEGTEAETIEAMAARYLRDLLEVRPVGPYLLGGLSFGGLVAFEMAQQLRRAGHTVSFLGLLDTRGPGYAFARLDRNWRYWLRQRLDYHLGNLSALGPKGKLAYLESRFDHQRARLQFLARRTWTGIRSRLCWGKHSPLGRAYWAAQRAQRGYRPDPYDGPLTLFRAENQPSGATDPTLGWGRWARGGLTIVKVGGTHVSMVSEPRLPQLGAVIRKALPAGEGPLA